MGVAERREREKEELRTRIVEAARDIVSDEGLDALSMRALAERIEYSPATIYLYFQDKNELIQTIVQEGFVRLGASMRQERAALGPEANVVDQYRAQGRAYVKFALENTAYFRVMFELPTVASMDAWDPVRDEAALPPEEPWERTVAALKMAADEGLIEIDDPLRGALVGWGMLHGLISLYLSGHLANEAASSEEFLQLVEDAMDLLYRGWAPRGTAADGPRTEE